MTGISKTPGLMTSLEPVPLLFRARGTTRESLIEGAKQKHTQREGLYALRRPELGVEESVKDQASHTVQLPAPLQQQSVPPGQNVATYTANHCLSYGFSAISEAPISSNRLDIPTPIGTIVGSSMLPQHPGTETGELYQDLQPNALSVLT